MPDIVTLTNTVTGGAVTAQGTPDMTVAVASGQAIVANVASTIAAGNQTISAAHATLDRIDAIVNTGGTTSVLTGTLPSAGDNPQPPDTTGYTVLATVYVLNQAHPLYTGTITSTVITDKRSPVLLPEPANTMAFTFLSSAQSGDPGAGNCGFDTTSLATLATLYVNYQSPTWGQISGTGGHTKLIDWLAINRSSPLTPFYLRMWSRKQPNIFVFLKVTGVTDHTTYATLAVTEIAATQPDLGSVGTAIPLSTDAADTILEFNGAVPPPLTNGTAALTSGDITMTTANTWYDGPSLASIGGSGQTLLMVGHVQVVAPASTGKCTCRLWDGATVYAEQEFNFASGSTFSISLTALVSPSAAATYKMSCANTVNGGTIKRQTPDNSIGGTVYTASQMSYVRVT